MLSLPRGLPNYTHSVLVAALQLCLMFDCLACFGCCVCA